METWPKRKFGGKHYRFYDSYNTKKEAESAANNLRGKGYLVRISRPKSKLLPYYELWRRRKGK